MRRVSFSGQVAKAARARADFCSGVPPTNSFGLAKNSDRTAEDVFAIGTFVHKPDEMHTIAKVGRAL